MNDKPTKRKRNKENEDRDKNKKGTKKPYIPAYRSGGYGILLTLFRHDKNRGGMSKDLIINLASPLCDRSFTSNPSSGVYYSSWNSVKTLINNDLVYATNRPTQYFITDEGERIAEKMLEVASSNKNNKHNTANLNKENPQRITTPTSTHLKINKDRPAISLLDDNIYANPNNRRELSRANNSKILQPLDLHNPSKQTNISIPKKSSHSSNSVVLNPISSIADHTVWEPGSFKVILVIDNREVKSQDERNFFQEQISLLGVESCVRPLTIGDALWIAKNLKTGQETILNYILERKRLDDLMQSIKDGRYEEQKVRMRRSAIENIIYLVEETGADRGIMAEAIQTSMSKVIMITNFFLKRTSCVEESVKYLAQITEQIKEVYKTRKLLVPKIPPLETQVAFKKYINGLQHNFKGYDISVDYGQFQEMMSKTGNFTLKQVYLQMLMATRGVSLEKAKTIQRKYPTPSHLLNSYSKLTSISSRKLLLFEQFGKEIGNKKIGKALSEKIYEVWGAGA